MVLCGDCNSNGSKYVEYLISESFQHEQEHRTSEIEEDEGTMTGHAHHANEDKQDQNDGKEYNDDSNDTEQSSEKQDATSYSVFVKNKQTTSETCKKCTRKILNGVRCRECVEAIHWSCAGVPKDKSRTQRKNF